MMRFKKFKFPRIVAAFEHKEHIILRDFLALERTTLANERTLFAYLRTSLYLIFAGIAFLEIKRFEHLDWLGYAMFGFSTFIIVYGFLRYTKLNKRLNKFYKSIDFEEDEIKSGE